MTRPSRRRREATYCGGSLPDLLAPAPAPSGTRRTLVTLAEAPEDRPAAREWLVANGYRSTDDDLACFMDAL